MAKTQSTKSFNIDLPADIYDEVINNASDAKGYRETTQLRGDQNQMATIKEQRTREQFLNDSIKADIVALYKRGAQMNISKAAVLAAAQEIEQKAKSI